MAFWGREDHDGGMKRVATSREEALRKRDKQRKPYTIEGLWAELQQVRAALEASERRATALEVRVQELEAENSRLRKSQWATEDFLQKKIRKLEKDVADRDGKIEKLKKQVAWFRKQQFGQKTEKSSPQKSRHRPRRLKGKSKRAKGIEDSSRAARDTVEQIGAAYLCPRLYR